MVQVFSSAERPITAKGKLALARALLLSGDRAGAQALVRDAWRNDAFPDELENPALDIFHDLLTPADLPPGFRAKVLAEAQPV